MCTHAHHEQQSRSSLRAGSFKRALEALGVSDALSCHLSLFKHSNTKYAWKKTVDHFFFGGGGGEGAPAAPPL